jgi:hypothetical protein
VHSPKWVIAGAVVVSGDTSSYPALGAFLNGLVVPNHAWDDNDVLVGPGTPHDGPYEDELYTLVTGHGATPKQAFTSAEFNATTGVIIMLNIVPSAGAAVGSSVDFSSGPIVGSTLFPFAVHGTMYRNGAVYDPAWDNTYGGYASQNPPIAKDGPSHFPWFFAENTSFGPSGTPAEGSYEFNGSITDATGAGWDFIVPFTVSP